MSSAAYKIAALRKARHHIVCHHTPVICVALSFVARNCPHLRHTCCELQRYIEAALETGNTDDAPVSTLAQWIKKHQTGTWLLDSVVRQYRLQWIDWMIAQLQEES